MSRLHPYVPPFARRWAVGRDRLAADFNADLRGALFIADIAGFTALTERKARGGQAGIEEMQAILNRCFERIVAVIDEGGGEVYKFAGDATIAWWPAVADAPREAVLAAAATALRLQALVPELERAARVPLSLRIGIGAGRLFTAVLGGVGGRWEAVLGGDALAQVAAAQTASSGQVVLSAQAFALLGDDCSGVALAGGHFALDGVTPPLPLEARRQPPEPAEAMVAPFVPRHVVERVQASPHDWLAELRYASVLFASVDAARELASMQHCVEAMQRSVYDCGGSVVQCLVDDKDRLVLVGAWGIPGASHANDAERAIRAAHALHAALAAAGRAASVGVASGRLFAGMRGAPSRSEFALIGAAINLAARLAEAAGGRIWCDEASSRAAPAIAFGARGAVALRGIGEVAVFEPLGRRHEAAAVAPALIGRDAELAALQAALQRVRDDPERSAVVVVEGEPGIGKSHLAAAFAQHVRDAGLVLAAGASEPLDSAGAYRPLGTAVHTLLGLDALDGTESRRDRVLALIGDAPAQHERAALIGPLLELPFAATPTTQAMSGHGRVDATAELLVHLLGATATAAPRVVLLEDVHWLDSPSWVVIDEAAQRARGLLMVLVSRPLAESPLPARALALLEAPATTRLRLSALDEKAVRAMIRAQLGVAEVPDGVVRTVSDKTQGIPLFVRQVLGALVDRGIVRVEAGIARCDERALAAFAIPETIQGAVISRIDRLTPRQQLTLKKASVVGRSFTIEALGSADAGEVGSQDLRADIEAIAQRGLVEPGEGAGEYAFSHTLVRDAVYDLLPFERRRALHAALASWYERRAGDDPAMLDRIAVHHAEAHDPARAPPALEKAGDRALRTGAYREAQALFRRLVDIADHGFGDGSTVRVEASAEERARWRQRLGHSSFVLGDLEAARHDLEAAAALLGEPLPGERMVSLRLGLEIARALLRGLLRRNAAPRREQTRERLLARTMGTLSRIYNMNQRAQPMLYTVMRRFNLLAGEAPHAEQMGAYSGLMYLLMMVGRQRLGDRYAARIVELQRALQQPLDYADATFIVSLAYLAHARWDECERYAAEAERIFARLGERQLRMAATAVLAHAAELRGRFADSGAHYRTLLQMADETGDALSRCWATGGLAMIAIREGRFEDGAAMARIAVGLARTIGEVAAELTSSGSLAICALETGDIAGARSLVEEGLGLLLKMPRFATAQHVLNGVDTFSEAILLLWERDAPPRGSAGWKLAARQAALASQRLDDYARVFAIGAPAAANRRALLHWLHGRRAKAIAEWKHGIAEGERRRIPYETGKVHLELARHLPLGAAERRRHAEAAAAIFAGIGAPALLSRARDVGQLEALPAASAPASSGGPRPD